MKRTRKWLFVAQEASRLAGLGLSPKVIAGRLGVNKSSVTRWMAEGKLATTRVKPCRPEASIQPPVPRPPKTPAEWADDVRSSYDLDATDDQLVTVAESALALSLDVTTSHQVRLQAAGRFQAIVKQLALVARVSDAAQQPQPVAASARKGPERIVRRRNGVDPRTQLMAVK